MPLMTTIPKMATIGNRAMVQECWWMYANRKLVVVDVMSGSMMKWLQGSALVTLERRTRCSFNNSFQIVYSIPLALISVSPGCLHASSAMNATLLCAVMIMDALID
jgi:predicted small integral membrane protein